MQTDTVSLGATASRADVRATVFAGIDRYAEQMSAALGRRRVDLFLLPEKALGDREHDLRGCVEVPGPEIERLQEVARRLNVFIGANAYTLSRDFPGRYFNTSFLIDRAGNLILKSYRLHTYHSTSPHDFWARFLDKVGLDGAFPVARTELGNIAMLPSMELMYPEVARLFVLRGAEILLHTTMERIVDRSTKRARAAENLVYLLSANVPRSVGPDRFMDVSSLIVNWRGQELADCPQGTEGFCSAEVDVAALRRRRADPDLTYPPYGVNYLSRLRTEIAAEGYRAVSLYPPDTYRDGTAVTTAISPDTANAANLRTALHNMAAAGMLPASPDQSVA